MRHGLFVYETDEQLVDQIAPLLRTEDERVVVIVDARKRELLADALEPAMVTYIDRDGFYTRPEAALAGYDELLRRNVRDGVSAVRAFAELPRCESDAEWDRWLAYEAIVNRALAHHSLWVTCGYDAREVPRRVLDAALESHPELLAQDWRRSTAYKSPETVVASRTPAPAAPADLRPLAADGAPRGFRTALSDELEAAGVPEPAATNLLVAAGEVFANAFRHGGGAPRVRIGRVGGRFVCEVSDDGPGLDDPLAGFLPPRPGHEAGAGLWAARQLSAGLEVVPSERGATVRLWA
jgi:anti-sigma regulatory factor (Ser/Thr protein kinase)